MIFESARITSRLLADDLDLQPHWGPSLMAAPDYEPALAETV